MDEVKQKKKVEKLPRNLCYIYLQYRKTDRTEEMHGHTHTHSYRHTHKHRAMRHTGRRIIRD